MNGRGRRFMIRASQGPPATCHVPKKHSAPFGDQCAEATDESPAIVEAGIGRPLRHFEMDMRPGRGIRERTLIKGAGSSRHLARLAWLSLCCVAEQRRT